CDVWRPQFVGMEANGFQVTVAQEARRKLGGIPVREIEPGSKSKLSRAVPAVELASAGRVYVPDDAEWATKYLTELSQWTAQDGDRDGQVDVTAYAAKEVVERYAAAGEGPMAGGGRRG